MNAPPKLFIASKRCAECLVSKGRIVPGSRAAEIIQTCRREGRHFVCHKGSIAGINLHCRGVHDAIGPSPAYRFGIAIGVEIIEVDPDQLIPNAGGECASQSKE